MYRRILFPIDITDRNSWEGVLPQVTDLAKSFNSHLIIMNVIPDYGLGMVQEYFPKGWIEDLIAKSETALDDIIRQYFPTDLKVTPYVTRGAIYSAVIDYADASRSDLIAIPAYRQQSKEYLLGPNAAKVVRHSKISVLVMRGY